MTETLHYIDLPTGETTVIDKADLELVSGFKWHALPMKNSTYVAAWHNRLHILLHRLIIGAGPSTNTVDHVNRDTLDNRRSNLRLCTRSQNGANRVPDNRKKGTTSRFKGVSLRRDRGHWVAHIHVNGKTRYLGRHPTEEDAARAYDAAALETWGEFARLNFPEVSK